MHNVNSSFFVSLDINYSLCLKMNLWARAYGIAQKSMKYTSLHL